MTGLPEHQERVKQHFIQERGYWNEYLDDMLMLDPDFLQAYLNFSAVPWTKGTLDPKFKELIYVALDGSAMHLYEPGLRQHIRNALRLGATKQEVLEVLQLVSVVGIHSCTVGVPILVEESERQESP